ncbi:hypothetical protein ES705_40787 [subsurface metagenome]
MLASCSAVASLSLSITPVIPIVFKVLVLNSSPNPFAASFASSVGFKKARNTPLIEVIASSVRIPALVNVAIVAPKSSKLKPAVEAIAALLPIAGANSANVVLPRLTVANKMSETSPASSASIP